MNNVTGSELAASGDSLQSQAMLSNYVAAAANFNPAYGNVCHKLRLTFANV